MTTPETKTIALCGMGADILQLKPFQDQCSDACLTKIATLE